MNSFDSISKIPMSSSRLDYIDTVKVVTMLLVILGHCTYYCIETSYGGLCHSLPEDMEASVMSKILSRLSGFIYSFHMPLFMAVSGACFSFSISRYGSFKSLVRNKFHRLLVPFLVTTTFVSIPLKYCSGYYDGTEHVLSDIFFGQYLLLGNSHLWFVADLFVIFIVAYYIERSRFSKSLMFWCFAIFLSWVGYKAESLMGGEIWGILKHLIYFMLGMKTIGYFMAHDIRVVRLVISWLLMLIAWIVVEKIQYLYGNDFLGIKVLRYPSYTVFSIWGCWNMIFTCKCLCRYNWLVSSRLYNFFRKYSYELYLYSDPFNYVLIALLYGWLGYGVFTSNSGSLAAYLVRFVGTTGFAFLIISIINIAKKYIIRQK